MPNYFDLSSSDWLIEEKKFHPHKQQVYESIFTLGNGYLGVRGSLGENPHGSYRGTYIAGIFNKSESFVREIVKAPGWTDFSVWVGDHKCSLMDCRVLSHKRVLDMKKGILHRTTRFRNPKGRIICLETRRVVFAHQVRGAVISASVTAENFSGEIRVISGLNGDVTNKGYFPKERIKHLNLVTMQHDKEHVYLEVETRDDRTKIALAADTIFENPPAEMIKVNRMYGEKFAHEITFTAAKGKTYNFTKWVTTITSREGYERQLESTVTDLLHDMIREGLDYNLKKHIELRERMWDNCGIEIVGDKKAQRGIRFNLYHLMIVKPHHDPTVNIGAKFLTSEGYKGHAFWDTEIFILPFYIYNFPEDAHNLLMYRYYTLKGALENARAMGYSGAKYAWESADNGEETTPSYGIRIDGSRDRIFTGEEEHHIVADVAYGVYKYVEVTGDLKFLYNYGAEIIFLTARFWLSRIEKRRDRYEIRKVIGPDEFHEHVDNNAFTNYLAMWNLKYAVDLYSKMQKDVSETFKTLTKKIGLKVDEVAKMKVVSDTIFFPYDQKAELIEQFEGYFSLDDPKLKKLGKNGLPLYPPGVDPTNLHRTQLIKQADIVLLLYLFPDRFSPELKQKNYRYYEARTMHKSSLSPCIYAIMGLEVGDHKRAYDYFMKTSYIDLMDLNKNAHEGIHAAATGGAWMTIIHGFAGMKVRKGQLCFDPWLPRKWKEISYKCHWRGSVVQVKINHTRASFRVLKGKAVSLIVQGKPVKVQSKQTASVRLKDKH